MQVKAICGGAGGNRTPVLNPSAQTDLQQCLNFIYYFSQSYKYNMVFK